MSRGYAAGLLRSQRYSLEHEEESNKYAKGTDDEGPERARPHGIGNKDKILCLNW
jgi:hypothetical protein